MISLTRRQPLREMVSLHRTLEDAFSQPFVRPGLWGLRGSYPALDVYETPDDVVVKAVVPGIKPEDIKVTIVANTLTIEGETKWDEEVKAESYVYRERSFGRFRRLVTLPRSVSPDDASAEFENGVLTLTVPKAKEAKTRSIKIVAK